MADEDRRRPLAADVGFDPRSEYVRLVAGSWQAFPRILGISLSVSFHHCSIPVFIHALLLQE